MAQVTYTKKAIAQGIATKLTKKTGIKHCILPATAGGFIVLEIPPQKTKAETPVKNKPGKKPKPVAEDTRFVIKVAGIGKRGAFVTPAGGTDPWKFHANQFRKAEDAHKWAEEQGYFGYAPAQLTVEPFEKAWSEKAA